MERFGTITETVLIAMHGLLMGSWWKLHQNKS